MDIIVLKPGATDGELRHILKMLESRGLQANISKGTERTIVGVIGDTSKITKRRKFHQGHARRRRSNEDTQAL